MTRPICLSAWTVLLVSMATGLVLSWAPTAARAQFSMQHQSDTPFEWRGHIEGRFQTEFETDTNGGDSFESWTTAIAGDYGGPINESILIGIEGGYRYADYDFNLDGPTGVPSVYGSNKLPRKPWGSVNTLDITPTTTILIGSHFSLIAGVPIRFSAETGSQRNAWTAGISAILRWRISDTVRVGAGIGVTSELEENAKTFPIVSLDWEITNAFELKTEGSWNQGGQAVLLWGPNKAVRLSLSAGYERNRFRLDDNGSVTDRNGYGEITAVPVEVGLRLRLYENAFFDFRFGLGVGGRMRVESSSGQKLYDEKYDPAPRIGLSLNLPFGAPSRPAPDA